MSNAWETLSRPKILALSISFLGIYLIVLLAFIRRAKNKYKRQHARAYHRVEKFKDDLEQLEQMYDKEDCNE